MLLGEGIQGGPPEWGAKEGQDVILPLLHSQRGATQLTWYAMADVYIYLIRIHQQVVIHTFQIQNECLLFIVRVPVSTEFISWQTISKDWQQLKSQRPSVITCWHW